MSSFLDFIKQEEIYTSQNTQENTQENIQENTQENKLLNIEEIELINLTNIKNNTKNKFSFSKNEKEVKQMNNPNHNTFNEFFLKKGDFIKVIRTPRKYKVDELGNIQTLEQHIRLCDIYCGYIGEIKQFFKGNDSVMIILHALNNVQHICFPIECLVKIN